MGASSNSSGGAPQPVLSERSKMLLCILGAVSLYLVSVLYLHAVDSAFLRDKDLVAAFAGSADVARDHAGILSSLRSLLRPRPRRIAFRPAMNHSLLDLAWDRLNGAWSHWPAVGFCRNSSSLLDFVPHDVCVRRQCLYSPYTHTYVDLRRLREFQLDAPDASPFRFFDVTWQGDLSLCRQAQGGQLGDYHLHNNNNNNNKNSKSKGKDPVPQVSFVYTLHNNADIAAQSILEVFRTAHEAESAEFVVVHDASDEDMSLVRNLLTNLRFFFRVRIIEIEHGVEGGPQGYLRSNNEALLRARGEFALLLNSDVLVLPGWLTMLLHTMQREDRVRAREGLEGARDPPRERVGMVGALTLDGDGRVIEAGGGVFRDGTPYNSARGAWPTEMSMHHAREVDYISAACLLVRRELFLSLGLFDARYAPAYYEDTDAAFAHRAAGYKTLLQPFSVVLHFEGTTYGGGAAASTAVNTPSSSSLPAKEALMQKNAQRFIDSHKHLFAHNCPSPVLADPLHTARALDVHTGMTFYRQSPRILVLEDVIPEPDRDAGSIRLYELLLIMRELGYAVTLEAQPVRDRSVRYMLPLLAEGVNVVMPGTVRDMAYSAALSPLANEIKKAKERAETARKLNNTAIPSKPSSLCPWDLLFIARRDIFTRHWVDLQRMCADVPVIFDTVDVHFLRELRLFSLRHNNTNPLQLVASDSQAPEQLLEVLVAQKTELQCMRRSNITLVVSLAEQRVLKKLLGESADVRVISNIYRSLLTEHEEEEQERERTELNALRGARGKKSKRGRKHAQDADGKEGAVFVGNMCHTPNIDAVQFIVREVLQNVTQLPKNFKMHFVWSRTKMCPHDVLAEAERHPLVQIHRDISNSALLALHKRVKAVLAPLRAGAGVKGKVNYGLLHGVPVIATKIASEGMGLVHERDFLLAETGRDFVETIKRLYREPELVHKVVRGGRQVMRELFGRDVAKKRLLQVLEDLGVPPPSSPALAAAPPQCPLMHEYEERKAHASSSDKGRKEQWRSYWRTEKKADREIAFPLYPRLPFNDPAYLQYVE